jgi:small subunit ribosomal protein S17
MPATADPPISTKRIGTKIGVVESDKCDKTRKVVIHWLAQDPKYGKYVSKRRVIPTHDAKNESRLGDLVEISPCRPISKTKSWVLNKVVRKAAAVRFEGIKTPDTKKPLASAPRLTVQVSPSKRPLTSEALAKKPSVDHDFANQAAVKCEDLLKITPARKVPPTVGKSNVDKVRELVASYREWASETDNPPPVVVYSATLSSRRNQIETTIPRMGSSGEIREGVVLVAEPISLTECLSFFRKDSSVTEVYANAQMLDPARLFGYVQKLSRYLRLHTSLMRPVIVGPITGELVRWTSDFDSEFASVTSKPFADYCDWIALHRQMREQAEQRNVRKR